MLTGYELCDGLRTLRSYAVARGYPEGTYRPADDRLIAQAISLIARAMVAKGYWQPQVAGGSSVGPSVPESHRQDRATDLFYVRALPSTGQSLDWLSQPTTRGLFSRLLWDALDSYWRMGHFPE